MKLFISWSGERSKALAVALRDWIPLVLHYVEPWVSEADISAGERWADAVATNLDACNFGIICITRENLNSPWILFESGALAKSMQGGRVIPLLLDHDFREVGGPLSQFQAKKVEQKGLLEIVQSLNQAAAQGVVEDRCKQLFDALWPKLENTLGGIPKQAAPVEAARSQAEVLEELVTAVRAMESKARESSEEPRSSNKRGLRFAGIAQELGMMLAERRGDPVQLLLAASQFRDDAPWLYELGMDAYRQAVAGGPASQNAVRKFIRGLELARRGPFVSELVANSKLLHMALRETEFMIREYAGDGLEPSDREGREPRGPKAALLPDG